MIEVVSKEENSIILENTLNTFLLTGNSAIVYNIISQIMYYAVPLFVMISGTLFLNPEKEITIKELYSKYIKKIVIALILFGVLYSFLELYFDTRVISLDMLVKSFKNLITGDLWAHMWYIYLILGLYMITPLLKKFTDTCSLKEYNYLLVLLFIFTVILVDISSIFNINIAFNILIINPYILLFMLGDYLARFNINKKIEIINYFISIIFIILIVFNNIYNFMSIPITYTSVGVISICISLYLLCKNSIKNNEQKSIFLSITKCGFGIYLIHQFFINVIFKLLKFDLILDYPYLGLILYTFIIFITSYITTGILRKIKFVNKYIL